MNILITGGAGYIGSHTIIELLEQNYEIPYSIDNYLNSEEDNYKKIEKITNKKVAYYNIDLKDKETINSFFKSTKIDAVIHFAALKSVPESVEIPIECYQNNVGGLLNLVEAMQENNVNQLIFSSSCSVYGNPQQLPVNENTPFGKAESPYARSKQMGENILEDYCNANKKLSVISLRYFNPAGAHPSGFIGEGFTKKPNNLVPLITQTAVGLRDKLTVFGTDYNTKDGSCVRDYIHVVDVAQAHVKALCYFNKMKGNYQVINLGTGNGTTVLEIIKSFEKVSGKKLNYELGPVREGDVETIYADNSKAKKELQWNAKLNIDDMVSTAWKWQQNIDI
tara:strand:- start:174209 stop:175219 length:1011 start_codon:yes stop_codon:yes gene_type:complete